MLCFFCLFPLYSLSFLSCSFVYFIYSHSHFFSLSILRMCHFLAFYPLCPPNTLLVVVGDLRRRTLRPSVGNRLYLGLQPSPQLILFGLFFSLLSSSVSSSSIPFLGSVSHTERTKG